MPASNIDFTAVSHVIHFSVVPNSNGSLNSSANSLTIGNSSDVVSRGHAAGRKVLVCVGGAGSQTGFQGAASAANLSTFVTNTGLIWIGSRCHPRTSPNTRIS